MEEGFSSKLSGCFFFTSIPWVSAILLNNRVWAHTPVNKIAHCFNKQEELSPLGVALAANVLTAPLCNHIFYEFLEEFGSDLQQLVCQIFDG